MKQSKNFPPNYELINTAFPLNKKWKAIFCYKDTIYNPHGSEIREDNIKHEEVHSKQQGNDPDAWYFKYINDKDFRLNQELEAYATQYKFVRDTLGSCGHTTYLLDEVSLALSSELYGNLLTYNEAQCKIKLVAKSL